MRRGVAIGKFYPPHLGHSYLIEHALRHVDDLAVIVCDKAGQSIPGELRASWLREIHPLARVLVVPDTLPEDDSKAWASFTLETLGYVPDLVFTSEDYGDAYASFLGAQHVLVDRARVSVPISATAIRENPLAHWLEMAPCVRSHFARRVVVLGAESTGTTTMAKALADHYRTAWVPEYGRTYSEGKMAGDSPWETAEFVHIAEAQNALEDHLAGHCDRILICDTDSFTTSVWHERYMGHASRDVERAGDDRRYDLYLLTAPDIPFVQDGYRDGEHLRDWMHRRFEEALRASGKRFFVLSGDHQSRLQTASALCDQLLAEVRPI
jgi:NadR type nicotinamide-nucleotide adenylyltransferase